MKKRTVTEFLFRVRVGAVVLLIIAMARGVFAAFGLDLCQVQKLSWIPRLGVWYLPMLVVLGLGALVLAVFEFWKFQRLDEGTDLDEFSATWTRLMLIVISIWLVLVCQ